MKSQVLFILISLALICAGHTSCNRVKDTGSQRPERSFILGSGGGFTGAYETYKLFNTGRVEKQNEDLKSFNHLKDIPKDSAIACIAALDLLNLKSYQFEKPGNMTFFITIDEHSVRWSPSAKVRPEVKAFFKRTRDMIRAEYP